MTKKEQRQCFLKGEIKIAFALNVENYGDKNNYLPFLSKIMSNVLLTAVENSFRSLIWSLFCCSSQLQPACHRGLMALCALGLVSGDATLAGAALGELMKQKDGEKWGIRLCNRRKFRNLD